MHTMKARRTGSNPVGVSIFNFSASHVWILRVRSATALHKAHTHTMFQEDHVLVHHCVTADFGRAEEELSCRPAGAVPHAFHPFPDKNLLATFFSRQSSAGQQMWHNQQQNFAPAGMLSSLPRNREAMMDRPASCVLELLASFCARACLREEPLGDSVLLTVLPFSCTACRCTPPLKPSLKPAADRCCLCFSIRTQTVFVPASAVTPASAGAWCHSCSLLCPSSPSNLQCPNLLSGCMASWLHYMLQAS